jgi:hypothetical protein
MKAIRILLASFIVLGVSTTNVFAESDNAKIQRAMKAAPSSISAEAEIRDVTPGWPVLREAVNGSQWTCFPGVPLNAGDKHPMCNDIVWMEWLNAAVNLFYGDHTWTFTTDTVGYSYMLRGDALVNNDDVTGAGEGTLDQEGPHIMMLFPTAGEIDNLPRDPNAGGPYVMWDNQDVFPFDALIHVMVPLTDRDR